MFGGLQNMHGRIAIWSESWLLKLTQKRKMKQYNSINSILDLLPLKLAEIRKTAGMNDVQLAGKECVLILRIVKVKVEVYIRQVHISHSLWTHCSFLVVIYTRGVTMHRFVSMNRLTSKRSDASTWPHQCRCMWFYFLVCSSIIFMIHYDRHDVCLGFRWWYSRHGTL